MKTREVKSIAHDMINFNDIQHPLNYIWAKNNYKIDLIDGRLNLSEKDSITEFLTNKRKWFINRIKNLKGSLKDFEKAVITIYGAMEKLKIIYKGKKFSEEKIYGEWIDIQNKIKRLPIAP